MGQLNKIPCKSGRSDGDIFFMEAMGNEPLRQESPKDLENTGRPIVEYFPGDGVLGELEQ